MSIRTIVLDFPKEDWSDGPYRDTVNQYLGSGWPSVLPLPHERKMSPPRGYTGAGAKVPSRREYQRWASTGAWRNVCLRLPDGVIGIDVDAYGDKPGAATLAKLERKLGRLPATWLSTSRDNESGIRLYRAQTGLKWPSGAGPGIDIIQTTHRYVVVAPSVHPEGREYRWVSPDGSDEPPQPGDLPTLPDAWVQHLTGGEMADTPVERDLNVDVQAWLNERGRGEACAPVQQVLEKALVELNDPPGAHHDVALHRTMGLVGLAGGGHPGVAIALDQVRERFFATTKRDSAATLAREWSDMVTGAVQKVASEGFAPGTEDPCLVPSKDRWEFVSVTELSQPQPPVRFLVRGVWDELSHGVSGGEKKTLKSYNELAFALAVASGHKYLNKFDVERPGPVVVFVGEDAQPAYSRRLQRIAAAMQISPDELRDLPLHAVFNRGPVDGKPFADAVGRALDAWQPVLVSIDPLYAYHPSGVEVSNLYERGAMLAQLGELVTHDTALRIVDHFRKETKKLDLDSIAQTGMSQWAASWSLQRHAEDPDVENGKFLLEHEFGGRNWGGRRHKVRWDVGAFDEDTGQHDGDVRWEVTPSDYATAGGSSARSDRIEMRIVQLVTEEPGVYTRAKLATLVGGNRDAAFNAIDRLATNRMIATEYLLGPEGNVEKHRHRFVIPETPHMNGPSV